MKKTLFISAIILLMLITAIPSKSATYFDPLDGKTHFIPDSLISGSGSGDVTGPSSSTDGNFVEFNGTTGKVIKNSSYSPDSFVLKNVTFTEVSPSTAKPDVASTPYIKTVDSTTLTGLTNAVAGHTYYIWLAYNNVFDIVTGDYNAYNLTSNYQGTENEIIEVYYDGTTFWIQNAQNETVSTLTMLQFNTACSNGDFIFQSDVDDSPVNGATNVPISSNWAYDLYSSLGSAAFVDTTSFAPALGEDDNYVTDSEKIVIGNTSGTNSGDQDISGKLDISEIDDTPVNGETSAPISSNWAYDLINAADPFTQYLLASTINVTVQGYSTLLFDIASLTDPDADKLIFWDDSEGALKYLTIGTGLSLTGTEITATASATTWDNIGNPSAGGDVDFGSTVQTLTLGTSGELRIGTSSNYMRYYYDGTDVIVSFVGSNIIPNFGTLMIDDTAAAIQTGTTSDDWITILQLYDVDGAAYVSMLRGYNGNDPYTEFGPATNNVKITTAGVLTLNGTANNSNGEVSIGKPSTLLHKTWTFDPKAVCDGDVDRLFLMTVGDEAPSGIIIDEWKVSYEADPTTEADLDLKYADAFIGVANAAVIDVLDTTSGVSSEDTDANINSGNAVANGKVLYLEFGTAYTETGHQMIFEMWYHAN